MFVGPLDMAMYVYALYFGDGGLCLIHAPSGVNAGPWLVQFNLGCADFLFN